MSKNHHNSDLFKHALGIEENGQLPPLKPPSRGGTHTHNFKVLSNENRINELESKLLVLEQSQLALLNQIRSNELKSEIIKNEQLVLSNTELNNQERTEKIISILKNETQNTSSTLKNKVDIIEEVLSREEKFKSEQRENDLELFRGMFKTLIEKVGELIGKESEERMAKDVENKVIISNMTQRFIQENDFLKQKIEDLNIYISTKLNDKDKSITQRIESLSNYIEVKVAAKEESEGKSISGLKAFVSKLTEEVKNNIKNQDIINEGLEEQIKNIFSTISTNKNHIESEVKKIEDRVSVKVNDLKSFIIDLTNSKQQLVNQKLSSLITKIDSNFNSLVEDQIASRLLINKKINSIESIHLDFATAITSDIELGIIPRLQLYEYHLSQTDKSIIEMIKKCETELASMQMKLEVTATNDKIVRTLEYNEIIQTINRLKDDILDFGTNVQFDMGDMIKDYKNMFSVLNDSTKLIFGKIGSMESSTKKLFEDLYLEMENIQQMNNENIDKIVISNIMSDMIVQIESVEIEQELINQKNMDNFLNKRCDDFRDVLIKFSKQRDEDLSKHDIEMVMNNILYEFDKLDSLKLIEEEFTRTLVIIESLEGNVETKFKDTDSNVAELEVNINKKLLDVHDLLRTKKDIESEEEIRKIEAEINERKRNDELKQNLINENQRYRELLEVKTITDQIMTRLEFKNIYQNFEVIDKKFLRFDDANQTLKSKLTILESKHTKLDSNVNLLSELFNIEVTKIIVDNMVNRVTFDQLHVRVEYAVGLREQEERDMVKIAEMIEKRAEKTESVIEGKTKECNDKNEKMHGDALDNMDSKIAKALEKIKKDNIDMWAHSIVLQNKVTTLEEVRKIIQTIPPVIYDREHSLKKIYELEHSDEHTKYQKPNLLKAKGGNVENIVKSAVNESDVYKDDNWKNKQNQQKKDEPKKSGDPNEIQPPHAIGPETKKIPK